MVQIVLRKGWPTGRFQRTVKIPKKPIGRTLVFKTGEPVEVSDAEAKWLLEHHGQALAEATFDEKGRLRPEGWQPEKLSVDEAEPETDTKSAELATA